MKYRRLRINETVRSLVRETRICKEEMIYPLFVTEGENIKEEISSMPGNYRFSVDMLLKEVEECVALGLKTILLFGIPSYKDALAKSAYCQGNIVSRAIEEMKRNFKEIVVVADVCLCEYTNHGHCGFVENGFVNNEKTLPLLAKAALSYAKAGADVIAPSDMMDGRIKYIRDVLDKEGFSHVSIMAYSAKYCSAFYGPFREAADSAPQFGDRKSYQMDCANQKEALKEILCDVEEGADFIMVKPALSYLDVICRAKEIVNVPVCAYQVSGEYAMIKAADKMGWIDGKKAAYESLISIKRAGADVIITYFAKEFAKNNLE